MVRVYSIPNTLNSPTISVSVFFFNDTSPTEIYTLSLHDALPICGDGSRQTQTDRVSLKGRERGEFCMLTRSEEHTSELQAHSELVCRLLLEKKTTKKKKK